MSRNAFFCLAAVFVMSPAIEPKEPIFLLERIDGPVHAPEKKTFWYGPFSEGAAVFDINGDGHLDISAGANWYEGPYWKKHEGFRPSASIHGEYVNNCGEHAADVNGDRHLDIISAGWMKNGVWWYENPGPEKVDSVWRARKIVSSDYTEGLLVEDIDGDGDPDVLINHWGKKDGQGVTWLELAGKGEFRVHVLGTEGDVHGVGLGDLNGDGRKDIITPHGWYMAPENRAGEWAFYKDYRLKHEGSISMPVIDVNGDGRNDIVFGHAHSYGLGWLEQLSASESRPGRKLLFREHLVDESMSQYHALVLADVNQDGTLDLVAGKRLRGHAGGDPGSFDPLGVFWFDIDGGSFRKHPLAYNHLFWYPGEASKNSPPGHAVGTGMTITVVDVDRDGKTDIVVPGKSGLYLFRNRGLPPTRKLK